MSQDQSSFSDQLAAQAALLGEKEDLIRMLQTKNQGLVSALTQSANEYRIEIDGIR